MVHPDQSQHNPAINPQQQSALLQQVAQALLQVSQSQQGVGFGQGFLGQAAFGQGAYGYGAQGQNPYFGWGGLSPQRQLTQHDVNAVLQQIAPILPQIIAQAQQSYMPQAAFGGGLGVGGRTLSPHDVNEVVRQILPAIPQLLQSMQPQGMQPTAWQTGAGMFGFAPTTGYSQANVGWGQSAYGVSPQQTLPLQWGQTRQVTQQDIAEVARQLAEAIPATMGAQRI